MLIDVSHSFFSTASDNCLIVTLQVFILALMGMYQQGRGQVLGFGGTKTFLGERFLFLL